MEAKIFNQSGDEVGIIQLAEYIFGIEPNVPVMHQAMVRQQANARLGTSNTLRRGAPKARRIPISRMRCPTFWDMSAYKPRTAKPRANSPRSDSNVAASRGVVNTAAT